MKNGVVEMLIPIEHELSSCNKPLISNIPITFTLTRSKVETCLFTFGTIATTGSNSGDNAAKLKTQHDLEVQIQSAVLYIKRFRVSAPVLNAHEKMLKLSPAVYGIQRNVLRSFNFPSEFSNQQIISNIFSRDVPDKIYCFFLEIKQMSSLTSSPFNFKTHGCQSIRLIGDEGYINAARIETDFDSNKFIQAYEMLIRTMGKKPPFSIEQFLDGYFIAAFDLSVSSYASGDIRNIPRTGNVSMEICFSKQPATPIKLFTFGVFDSTIFLDSDRNLRTDYN